jgi:hypothetical protein
VIVQDYKSGADNRISLEIFEMQSSAGAYGMFTFKKGPHGEAIDLGDIGQTDDYYLNFCKGRYLVTITSLDQTETAAEGGLAIGRAVGSLIRETEAEPGLVARLPREALCPQSIRYFRGRLGVSNSLPLLAKAAGGITEGVKADYDSGRTICVFRYPDKELARRKWTEARAAFPEAQSAAGAADGGPVLVARDEKGHSFFARQEEDSIYYVIGALDLAAAGDALARVIEEMNAFREKERE